MPLFIYKSVNYVIIISIYVLKNWWLLRNFIKPTFLYEPIDSHARKHRYQVLGIRPLENHLYL